jgi:hypothetical protein
MPTAGSTFHVPISLDGDFGFMPTDTGADPMLLQMGGDLNLPESHWVSLLRQGQSDDDHLNTQLNGTPLP